MTEPLPPTTTGPASVPKLHIESVGQGADIVLLHGWGMNSAVFTPLRAFLSQYRVHYVDLPGFGHSQAMAGGLDTWVDALIDTLPNKAIWAGWSLGGLVATAAAIRYPQRVSGLITIASSPCFMANDEQNWPGIPPQVLTQFSAQLAQNLPKTIERFLAIQAMGSETAKEDIKQLRDLVLAKPLPAAQALEQGLEMLKNIDLRSQLSQIQQPWLRIWGRLDGLVPKRVVPLMPTMSNAEDVLLAKASHAPFISHSELFLAELQRWLAIHAS